MKAKLRDMIKRPCWNVREKFYGPVYLKRKKHHRIYLCFLFPIVILNGQ